MSAPAHLELKGLQLGYATPQGSHVVVRDLDLHLASGSIGCLLGPSGCGKTTVLRAICGFEPLQAGEITLHGVSVATQKHSLAPEKRQVGVMFQDYALFPHLSVADNIGFGLRKQNKAERAARVRELLTLIGLAQAGSKYPHELSGGQQQRVALARALAPRPELLLLDEPFSSLDIDLRERLAGEVRDILKQAGATAILVTHDQTEAFAMADEIGVMQNGKIKQWGSAYELYHQPSSPFVAGFIGQGVFVEGRAQTALEGMLIDTELGRVIPRKPLDGKDRAVSVLLRPDDIRTDESSELKARLLHKAFRGPDYLYTLELASGQKVLAHASRLTTHDVGDLLGVSLAVDQLIAFDTTR